MAGSALGVTLRQIQQLYNEGAVASLPDARLVEQFVATGDGTSFEALVARHGPMVLGVCRSILRNEQESEDAFQATFLILARKASLIRVEGTLSGWLYRVAHRVAVQAHEDAARRRIRERKGMTVAQKEGPERSSPWRDEIPVLYEEIDRLPERHRLPIILCYLEGMTYDQAARQLRWTEPTFRSRLSVARRQLRDRLTHRGVTGAGAILGGLLAERSVGAEVPFSLARAVVDAVVGESLASTSAALLASRVRWALTLAKFRIGALCLLIVSVPIFALALGAGPLHKDRMSAPPPVRKERTAKAAVSPSPETPGETVTIRGRVVDPTGKPVIGATLRPSRFSGEAESAVSHDDGRFTFPVPRAFIDQFVQGEIPFAPGLIASAPGFGLGWAEVGNQSGVVNDVTVRLAADDVPIEGRVLDLEGRPIAGVEITTSSVFAPRRDDLTPWLEKMKIYSGGPREGGLVELPCKMKRTTDANGRFRLDGIGRDRVVMFTVSGPTIVFTRTFAMTKNVPPLYSSNTRIVGPKTMTFHGARFDFAVEPCKLVEGVVRDQDTGQPVAGIRVKGMANDERSLVYYDETGSVTDQLGRYRLLGISKAAKVRYFLVPDEKLPYLPAMLVEPVSTSGLNPATIDLRLKRGTMVRGRVTDKVTGKPIKIGSVSAFARSDNPHLKDYPAFRDGAYATGVATDEDGRFEIAVVPGRGILGVNAGSDRYLRGVGAESLQQDAQSELPVRPRSMSASHYNLVAAFDTEAIESSSLNLQVDPGQIRSVTVLDPDGKPLSGGLSSGRSPISWFDRRPLDSATFEVVALDPRYPRLVMVHNESRKLGGWALIDAKDPRPVTIQARPFGVIMGRLVDAEGRPRTRLELSTDRNSDSDPVFFGRNIVDQEGRFRIEIIPGLSYSARAFSDSSTRSTEVIFKDIKLEPGQVRDLGNMQVR